MCNDGCGIKPSTGIDCSSALCSLGTCLDTNTEPFYKCDCGDFFTGKNCETHNNPCTNPAANPCGEGTCTFSPGKGSGTVTCTCDSDYETAFGAGMTTVKWGNSEVLQSPPCTVRKTRGVAKLHFTLSSGSLDHPPRPEDFLEPFSWKAASSYAVVSRTSSVGGASSRDLGDERGGFGAGTPMESFFQAALNSVLEAAGGGLRSTRTNSASSSTSNIGSTRTDSRSSASGGISSQSGGNAVRPSRFTGRAATTSTSSGDSSAMQGCRREPPNGAQAQHTGTDQAGRANKSGENVPAGGRSGSSSSSSSKGVSAPGVSLDPAGKSQVTDRQEADRLKDLGNESFRRGMYGLAAEYYSRAIAVDATVASYFTNRALCHKREKRYPEALEDAEAALALDETNVKGLYIKGDALVQLGDYDAGVSLLEKAQTASSSGAGRASNEIRHSLLNGMPKTSFINEREQTNQLLRSSTGSTNLEMREEYWASASCIEFSAVGGCCASAKKLRNARWRRQRSVDRKDLEAFLKECIEVVAQQRRLPMEEVNGRLAQLEHLVAEAAEADAPFEIPDFLTCKISMGLMDEPVVTPSGITYENKLLLEHLNRNGPTDPLTRRAISSVI
ncbi:TPR domain-containing protein, putative [Eimeria acervulina]|uniref:RING-type E3 ubiquitin transferase n=1 Tax=Eimeria acervulina TaxID=5801 RepID=U6GBK9_EIMAC|nr:TPR domain-containing protein, putative [Eimeria acervulina]CDI76718.1 TPR domain-containing protein, putative [Eimeria acervulina]